jgi:hypothetical protein
MPAWIHDRADHIRSKNPSMPKSEAFAIATQQSHALGKSPKGYGTTGGRATAKDKYKTPEDDVKTAMDPSLMSSLKGVAGAGPALRGQLTNVGQKFTGSAAGQVSSMARKGTLLQNAPAPRPMIRALAVEPDPFAKAAMVQGFLDEFTKISAEKDSGFMDSIKGALNTPIPGTPELFGGAKGAIEKATRGGAAGKGPSAGFLKFQQQLHKNAGMWDRMSGALGAVNRGGNFVGGGGAGPSQGFQSFQQQGAARAPAPAMAPPAPQPSAPRALPPMNQPLNPGGMNMLFSAKSRGPMPAPVGMRR